MDCELFEIPVLWQVSIEFLDFARRAQSLGMQLVAEHLAPHLLAITSLKLSSQACSRLMLVLRLQSVVRILQRAFHH